MKYADYFRTLDFYIQSHPLKLGDGESVLALLYESYNELQEFDNEQIKADFNELYRLMNGCRFERWTRSFIRSVPFSGITKKLDLLKA